MCARSGVAERGLTVRKWLIGQALRAGVVVRESAEERTPRRAHRHGLGNFHHGGTEGTKTNDCGVLACHSVVWIAAPSRLACGTE